MLTKTRAIYRATRKRNDQLFNTCLMRPTAAFVVGLLERSSVTPNQLTLLGTALFAVAAGLLIGLPTPKGALIAIAVLEFSYLFDCVDGMLARHKKIANKQGHLFDYFSDEIKAVMLIAALAVRVWRTGGLGFDLQQWPAGDERFLLAGIAGVVVIGSATSLTNFLRRPELTGKEMPTEAHYETVEQAADPSLAARLAHAIVTFLRFLNHYPSHIWLFALLGRLDLVFWIYGGINLLYLGRGWLGLVLRFGRG